MIWNNVYCVQGLEKGIILFSLILNRNYSKVRLMIIYWQIIDWLSRFRNLRKNAKIMKKRKMEKIWVFEFQNIDFSRKKNAKSWLRGVQNSVPMVWKKMKFCCFFYKTNSVSFATIFHPQHYSWWLLDHLKN
jgi:hypothetical protein